MKTSLLCLSILFSILIITPASANQQKVAKALNQFYAQEEKDIAKHFPVALKKSQDIENTCGTKINNTSDTFTVYFVRFQFLSLDYQKTHRNNLQKLQKSLRPYRKKNSNLYRITQKELKNTPQVASEASKITVTVFCNNIDNPTPNPLHSLNNTMSTNSYAAKLHKEYPRLRKYKLSKLTIKQLKNNSLSVGFSEKQSRELKLL